LEGRAGPRTTLKSVSENVNTIQANPTREGVYSSIECLSGRIFLVPIPDCAADPLPQFHQDMD